MNWIIFFKFTDKKLELGIANETKSVGTYEDTIESRRIAAPLHVTQHRDPRVLLELFHDHLAHLLCRDGIAISVDSPFRYDNDIQSLACEPFLRFKKSHILIFSFKYCGFVEMFILSRDA